MTSRAMHFWRDPTLGAHGVDLLAARDTDHHYVSHFHEEYVVSVFEGGAQRHRIGNREAVATAGTLIVIPPGELHDGEPGITGGRWSHRAFYPDAATLRSIADDLFVGRDVGELDFATGAVIADGETSQFIAACHRRVSDTARDPMERQQAFGDAMELLLSRHARIGQARRKPGDERSAIRSAIEHMQDRLGDADLAVGDLASAAGLSPFYFMRSFRKSVGMTAHAYLIQLRLSAARQQLALGAAAADAAIDCGFFDQSHLIRHFRKVYGVTPGRYGTTAPTAGSA